MTISVGSNLIIASDMAAPRVFVEPDVDCVGNWLGCGADCLKFYEISMVVSGQGVPCPHDWGAEKDCAPSEGMCPATDRTSTGKLYSQCCLRGRATHRFVGPYLVPAHHHRRSPSGHRSLHCNHGSLLRSSSLPSVPLHHTRPTKSNRLRMQEGSESLAERRGRPIVA